MAQDVAEIFRVSPTGANGWVRCFKQDNLYLNKLDSTQISLPHSCLLLWSLLSCLWSLAPNFCSVSSILSFLASSLSGKFQFWSWLTAMIPPLRPQTELDLFFLQQWPQLTLYLILLSPILYQEHQLKNKPTEGRILYARTLGFQLIPYLLESNSLHHLRRSSPTLPTDLAESCSKNMTLKTFMEHCWIHRIPSYLSLKSYTHTNTWTLKDMIWFPFYSW